MTEGEHSKDLIEASGREIAEHADPGPTFLDMVERLAARPDIPVEKIKQIMDMQEHILDRQAKQEYNAAMVRAQARFKPVPMNGWNDHTKSKYALYADIVKTLGPDYTDEGFAVSAYEGETEKSEHIRVCMDIMHEGGWTETKWADIPIDDKGPGGTKNKTATHAKGSSLSYGKSYLARGVWNIATSESDDDGNAAGGTAALEFITADQKDELVTLSNEAKMDDADITRLLAVLEVDDLDTLPQGKFIEAKNLIIKMIKHKAKS